MIIFILIILLGGCLAEKNKKPRSKDAKSKIEHNKSAGKTSPTPPIIQTQNQSIENIFPQNEEQKLVSQEIIKNNNQDTPIDNQQAVPATTVNKTSLYPLSKPQDDRSIKNDEIIIPSIDTKQEQITPKEDSIKTPEPSEEYNLPDYEKDIKTDDYQIIEWIEEPPALKPLEINNLNSKRQIPSTADSRYVCYNCQNESPEPEERCSKCNMEGIEIDEITNWRCLCTTLNNAMDELCTTCLNTKDYRQFYDKIIEKQCEICNHIFTPAEKADQLECRSCLSEMFLAKKNSVKCNGCNKYIHKNKIINHHETCIQYQRIIKDAVENKHKDIKQEEKNAIETTIECPICGREDGIINIDRHQNSPDKKIADKEITMVVSRCTCNDKICQFCHYRSLSWKRECPFCRNTNI